MPTLKLEVGHEVWLLYKYIKTTRPSIKLDFKYLEKFKIIKKISSYAYKLKLPTSIKLHPVFHISLLKPVATDPLLEQTQPLPPPIIIDDKLKYEVNEIGDSKLVYKLLKYLVYWVK